MKVLLLQVLVTLAVLKSAFAVYCYDCSSVVDTRCGEAFKPFPKAIVNCDDKPLEIQGVTHNATFCRKIIQSIHGQTRVTRSCGYILGPRRKHRCRRTMFTEATKSTYCDCDEDFCNGFNGTSRLSLSVFAFIGLAFVVKVMQ